MAEKHFENSTTALPRIEIPLADKFLTHHGRFEQLMGYVEDTFLAAGDSPLEELPVTELTARNKERFVKIFLKNVLDILMHHDLKDGFPITQFHRWLTLPVEVTDVKTLGQKDEAEAFEARYEGNDVRCVKHPLVQLQICFLKVLEGILANGELKLPKPLLGGAIDFDAYTTLLLERDRRGILETLRTAQRVYTDYKRKNDLNQEANKQITDDNKKKPEVYVTLFDYDLRDELARKGNYTEVGRFKGYGLGHVEEDLAIATTPNNDWGSNQYLIRRDGSPFLQDRGALPLIVVDTDATQPCFIFANAEGYHFFASIDQTCIGEDWKARSLRPFKCGRAVMEKRGGWNVGKPDGTLMFPRTKRWEFSDFTDNISLVTEPSATDRTKAKINYLRTDGTWLWDSWHERTQDHVAQGFNSGAALFRTYQENGNWDPQIVRPDGAFQRFPEATSRFRSTSGHQQPDLFEYGILPLLDPSAEAYAFFTTEGKAIPLPYQTYKFPFPRFDLGVVSGLGKQGLNFFNTSGERLLKEDIKGVAHVVRQHQGLVVIRMDNAPDKEIVIDTRGKPILDIAHSQVSILDGCLCARNPTDNVVSSSFRSDGSYGREDGYDGSIDEAAEEEWNAPYEARIETDLSIYNLYRPDGSRVLRQYAVALKSIAIEDGICLFAKTETSAPQIVHIADGSIHDLEAIEAGLTPETCRIQLIQHFNEDRFWRFEDGIIACLDDNSGQNIFYTITGKRIFTHNNLNQQNEEL